MATLDCAHARSFHVAPSFFDKRGGERGFFFFFFYGCATAFRTHVRVFTRYSIDYVLLSS